jgi:protein arginine N-methyltransferase 2
MATYQTPQIQYSEQAVHAMLQACAEGSILVVKGYLDESRQHSNPPLAAALQDQKTGISPLMAAAEAGHLDLCNFLLEEGAPWNAVDRMGKCAGNHATEKQHWDVVNLLVDAGTKAELLLGAAIRLNMQNGGTDPALVTSTTDRPVGHEPCTKPDYLSQKVRYNAANTALLDQDDDAVMMEWERPLMDAHASIITGNSQKGKVVLNVGFGMGIIDTALQILEPAMHYIIEAHPDVYKKMINDGWDKIQNVRICFGRWQDEFPKLMNEGVMFDGIFYDTYGEHFTDLEDFHEGVARTLKKPSGVYSFFNGLAPDNLFFHGVACQCVKLQLARMGMDSEFAGEFYSIRFNIYCSKQNFICILTIVTLISFLTLYTKSMPNPSER